MSSTLNPLDKDMRDAVRTFFKSECTPNTIRNLHNGENTGLSDLWSEIHSMGLSIALVPEHMGGLGMGMVAAVQIAEEAGSCLMPLPLSDAILAAPILFEMLDSFPINLQEQINSVYSGADFIQIATPWGNNHWRTTTSYSSKLVIKPDNSNLDLVSIKRADTHTGIDKSMPFGIFSNNGFNLLHNLYDEQIDKVKLLVQKHRLMQMSELLGVAHKALDLAIEYACEREQFGKPIGANQAIKHNLADRWMQIDNARLAIAHAAKSLDNNSDDKEFNLDAAQILSIEAGNKVTAYSVQVFGAMGITWECDVHLYLKRSKHLQALLEKNNTMGTIYARIWQHDFCN